MVQNIAHVAWNSLNSFLSRTQAKTLPACHSRVATLIQNQFVHKNITNQAKLRELPLRFALILSLLCSICNNEENCRQVIPLQDI